MEVMVLDDFCHEQNLIISMEKEKVLISGCSHAGIINIQNKAEQIVADKMDMVVLDWGIFCHSKKIRIPGTEDMDKDYTDYLFHVKGAIKGTVLGIIVAILSGVIILLAEKGV